MKLSICIPTFDRRVPLLKLLESIDVAMSALSNADGVEVVICDNGSTDGTEQAISAVISKMAYLRYFRNDKNEGFAYNLNRTVELARGEYCWLLGSDEQILPESLLHIIEQLSDRSTILIGLPITKEKVRDFYKFREPKDQKIVTVQDLEKYVSQCNEISALFAFISTIVISRKFWHSVSCSTNELCHPYTHMLRISKGILLHGAIIRCINFPIVSTGHVGNEWNTSVLPHLELDLLTITYLLSDICPPSASLKNAYGAVFRRQYGPFALLKAKIECKPDRWNSLVPILLEFGYGAKSVRKFNTDRILYLLYILAKYLRNKYNKSKSIISSDF